MDTNNTAITSNIRVMSSSPFFLKFSIKPNIHDENVLKPYALTEKVYLEGHFHFFSSALERKKSSTSLTCGILNTLVLVTTTFKRPRHAAVLLKLVLPYE